MDSYDSIYNQFVHDFQRRGLLKINGSIQSNIDPLQIISKGISEDNFWDYHGENERRYKELVMNYQKANKVLMEKGTLEHLLHNDPVRIAYENFHKDEPIRLIDYNGKLIIDGNGRHRIECAKLLKRQGYDIAISAFVTTYALHNQQAISIKNKMAMSHLIEDQIELLHKAKDIFMKHSQEIIDLRKRLSNEIRGLEQDELNHDYLDFIEEVQEFYNNKLMCLDHKIQDEIIPQINRKIQYLEDRI